MVFRGLRSACCCCSLAHFCAFWAVWCIADGTVELVFGSIGLVTEYSFVTPKFIQEALLALVACVSYFGIAICLIAAICRRSPKLVKVSAIWTLLDLIRRLSSAFIFGKQTLSVIIINTFCIVLGIYGIFIMLALGEVFREGGSGWEFLTARQLREVKRDDGVYGAV